MTSYKTMIGLGIIIHIKQGFYAKTTNELIAVL